MKPPYIKALTSVGKHRVYLVDGAYIRKNISGGKDFTNFAQSGRFPSFIPKGEFWLDQGYNKSEETYFLDNMLKEASMMENGASFGEAHAAAIKQEKRERMKARVGARLGEKADRSAVAKINKTPLSQYDTEECAVYLVDGKAVRDNLFADFADGGNDKAYGFIPSGEVWLDSAVEPSELPFFAHHEIVERDLMAEGKPYIVAHRRANDAEHRMRMEKQHDEVA